MLLPAIAESILLYGGIALAVLAALVYQVQRDEDRLKEMHTGNLPAATIVGAKPSVWWRVYSQWAYAVLAIGAGVSIFLSVFATDVILVTDDGSSVTATRKVRLIGAGDYAMASGLPAPGKIKDPTWIVNESTRSVMVRSVHYGRSLGSATKPTIIPPGKAAVYRRVEHVGPSDPPPNEVQDTSKLGMDSRDWLTWD